MVEILQNLACQKIIQRTCVDVPLGDPKFRTLEREDSSMDQKQVHVEVGARWKLLWRLVL